MLLKRQATQADFSRISKLLSDRLCLEFSDEAKRSFLKTPEQYTVFVDERVEGFYSIVPISRDLFEVLRSGIRMYSITASTPPEAWYVTMILSNPCARAAVIRDFLRTVEVISLPIIGRAMTSEGHRIAELAGFRREFYDVYVRNNV